MYQACAKILNLDKRWMVCGKSRSLLIQRFIRFPDARYDCTSLAAKFIASIGFRSREPTICLVVDCFILCFAVYLRDYFGDHDCFERGNVIAVIGNLRHRHST